MHVDADLGAQVERAALRVRDRRDSVGIDRLGHESAQPPGMTAKTPAAVNSKTVTKVSLQLGEARDLTAVAGANVDDVDIPLDEEALGGLELRIAGSHQWAPVRAPAAPIPQSFAEAVILVVSGRDVERAIECPQVRNAPYIRRIGIVDEAEYLRWLRQLFAQDLRMHRVVSRHDDQMRAAVLVHEVAHESHVLRITLAIELVHPL